MVRGKGSVEVKGKGSGRGERGIGWTNDSCVHDAGVDETKGEEIVLEPVADEDGCRGEKRAESCADGWEGKRSGGDRFGVEAGEPGWVGQRGRDVSPVQKERGGEEQVEPGVEITV